MFIILSVMLMPHSKEIKSIDFFYLRNNTVDLNAGITLQTSSAKIDTIDTVGDNDLAFKRNNDSFMSFSQATGKIFLQKDTEIQGDATFVANKTVKVDNIDTVGNNDMIFKCNNTEYLKYDSSIDTIVVENTIAFSSANIYGNTYRCRSYGVDTVWQGCNTTSDGRIEIFRYEYINEIMNFSRGIDASGLLVKGNLDDTTVSDERLKEDIKIYEDGGFISCVKNTPVKTFKYKDEKFKKNDTFGFIAQELQKNLPEEMKNIVRESKIKGNDEEYLTINYIKLSVVLWGALQKEIEMREHIEASVYELIEEMKELKKTKPKAKAKAKN